VMVIEHPIANQDSQASGCDIVAMLGRKGVDRTGKSDPVVGKAVLAMSMRAIIRTLVILQALPKCHTG
jgi:hypothetical protein